MNRTRNSIPRSGELRGRLRRPTLLAALTALAFVAMMGLGTSTANAATVPASSPPVSAGDATTITPAQVEAAERQLLSSNLPRTVSTVGGVSVTSFVLNGLTFNFETSVRTAPGKVHPDLGGGFDSKGLYVSFNQVDQGALEAGGGAAIAIAICAIPAVGWVACAVAAAIVAAATYYAISYGKCPNSKKILRVYENGNGDGCYKS